MDWNTLLNIVHVQFATTTASNEIEVLKINKNIKDNVLYFVTLCNCDNQVKLTDFGKNKLYLNVTDQEMSAQCARFGLTYNAGVIEKQYKGIDDIHNFIALLDYLSGINK